jgi:hypothetical protein
MNDDRIYDKLDKIELKFENKMERLDNRLNNMEREFIIYNEELKHHIEGVRQLKRENDLLQVYIDKRVQELEVELSPVAEHVNRLQAFGITLSKIGRGMIKTLTLITLSYGAYSVMKTMNWF